MIKIIDFRHGSADDPFRLELVDAGLGLVVENNAAGFIRNDDSFVKSRQNRHQIDFIQSQRLILLYVHSQNPRK